MNHSRLDAARWRSRATEPQRCAFFSFLENINGKSRFACPAVCANGRTGKAGLAGGAGGSSPVSAQSTTKASEITTPIPPKSAPPSRNPESVPFWGNIALIARIRQTPCLFNFLKKLCLRVYVCVRVCVGYADQVVLRLHVASTPSLWYCGWRGDFCEITHSAWFSYRANLFVSEVLDLHRGGGAGSRSSVVLLGEFTGFASNLASRFTDTSSLI